MKFPSLQAIWNVAGPLLGLLIGAFLTYWNSVASWRRTEATALRVKLVQAYQHLWVIPTEKSRSELSLLMVEVEARCSGLRVDPVDARKARDAVLRLHSYVDQDVDVDERGRGDVIFHAMEAPKGLVEETWRVLDHLDRKLAARSKPWWGRTPPPLTPPFKRLEPH
jgi:hypothetical protein